MELDNLKEAWASLDNRLKRNEALNESIILEMIRSKARKTVNTIIAGEMISVAILILLVPFAIFLLDRFGGNFWMWDSLTIFSAVTCFVYPFWGVYKLHGLMKFDVTKNIGNNILCINKYEILTKREKKFVIYFLIPVLAILVVYSYVSMKASLPLWSFMICGMSVCGLVTYWSYKKLDKGIKSILKNLDEIREVKEECSPSA